MGTPEAHPSPQDLVEAYSINAVMNSARLPYNQAQELVDRAVAGEEADKLLIAGTFQGMSQYPSNRAALDAYFEGAWHVIDDDGRNFAGTDSNMLRNHEGKIVNEEFIRNLTGRGVAVELAKRQYWNRDIGAHYPVTVNNVWRLQRAPDGTQLPVAKVRTIDADASQEARPLTANVRPRDIHIAEKVVVFAGLTIPSTTEAK